MRASFPYHAAIAGAAGFDVDAVVIRDRRTTPADYDTQQFLSAFPVEVCWEPGAADYFTNSRFAHPSWLTVTGRATEEEMMNLLIMTASGKVREIKATEYNDLLAYHPTSDMDAHADAMPWTVTHRPSGWRVAWVESEQRALWLCQKLERVPLSASPDSDVVVAQARADGVWEGEKGVGIALGDGVIASLIRVAQRKPKGDDAAVIKAFFAGEAKS